LYDINEDGWSDELLQLLEVPRSVLPQVNPSSGIVAETAAGLFAARIPIAGIAGDQQAALFGQVCTKPGMAKNTYGTGCFMLMNTGTKPIVSKKNLVTTIAWRIGNRT
jgi:glycerol kinase